MTRPLVPLALVALFVTAVPADAHHSFSATYFDEVVTIEGELVQFLYRNPHSFVRVMVPDSKGAVQRWVVEWGAGLQLFGQGVTRETLKPGDHVIITGNPGRTESDRRLRMRSITRPTDGWTWNGTRNLPL